MRRVYRDRSIKRLGDGHFGLVAVLISDEGEGDRLAIGGLPRDGALRSGTRLLADLLLGSALRTLDAIASLVPV